MRFETLHLQILATGWSEEAIEKEIAKISQVLRGPLSNVERLSLIEDRQALRKELAKR